MGASRFVCLANSRKLGGRCVAGIRVAGNRARPGDWVRPVSTAEHGEVPVPFYPDGTEMRLGDIVGFVEGLRVPHAGGYQPENVSYSGRWTLEGRTNWADLRSLADTPVEPWPDGVSSSKGLLDRFPVQQAHLVRKSLTLQYVKHLRLTQSRSGFTGSIEVRGEFTLGSETLRLRVTDPVAEKRLQESKRDETVKGALVCLSLGEPFGGYVYKLLSGILVEGDR